MFRFHSVFSQQSRNASFSLIMLVHQHPLSSSEINNKEIINCSLQSRFEEGSHLNYDFKQPYVQSVHSKLDISPGPFDAGFSCR